MIESRPNRTGAAINCSFCSKFKSIKENNHKKLRNFCSLSFYLKPFASSSLQTLLEHTGKLCDPAKSWSKKLNPISQWVWCQRPSNFCQLLSVERRTHNKSLAIDSGSRLSKFYGKFTYWIGRRKRVVKSRKSSPFKCTIVLELAHSVLSKNNSFLVLLVKVCLRAMLMNLRCWCTIEVFRTWIVGNIITLPVRTFSLVGFQKTFSRSATWTWQICARISIYLRLNVQLISGQLKMRLGSWKRLEKLTQFCAGQLMVEQRVGQQLFLSLLAVCVRLRD